MTDVVKDLIKFHETEIEHNLWDALYTVFNSDGPNQLQYQYIGEFTEVMLGADICPTDYLDYIPEGYLYGTNVPVADIREGIQTLEMYCYGGCHKLKKVYLTDSVKLVKENAFAYCDTIDEVIIKNPTIVIDYLAFYDTSVNTIHYNGTMDEWNLMSHNISVKRIVCTDGEL